MAAELYPAHEKDPPPPPPPEEKKKAKTPPKPQTLPLFGEDEAPPP
jgi:hypothetical protein